MLSASFGTMLVVTLFNESTIAFTLRLHRIYIAPTSHLHCTYIASTSHLPCIQRNFRSLFHLDAPRYCSSAAPIRARFVWDPTHF